MTLAEILGGFLDRTDELDGLALANAVRRLAVDCAALVADHSAGEIAAIVQRAGVALIWIDAEAKDPDNRLNRHGRQRAMLDLLDLCEAIRDFHAATASRSRKLKLDERMCQEIADALRPLVAADD